MKKMYVIAALIVVLFVGYEHYSTTPPTAFSRDNLQKLIGATPAQVEAALGTSHGHTKDEASGEVMFLYRTRGGLFAQNIS